MTEKELRKLSRRDLLELLLQVEQQNEDLKARVDELEKSLTDRTIAINNAGSIAEAAMSLNGIFEDAQKAAAQYLENIKRCSEEQQSIYDKTVFEAERKAKEIMDSAAIEKQKSIKEADDHWKQLRAGLEAFYRGHGDQ